LKELHVEVTRLRRALSQLVRPLKASATTVIEYGAASAVGADLAMNTTATASQLTSTEEVNATSTSYTPFGPDWAQSSTSAATLDGTYDGDQSDDTLTFKVARGGTVGSDDIRVQVYNGEGDRIKTIRIKKSHSPGKKYNLPNGLKVSFAAGDLDKNDTFELGVSESVGSVVDTTKAFDGLRNGRPNFEYGTTVTAGSFQVNGTSITVNADDSIDAVLQRIADSAADVTATFDAATERIVMTRKTAGSHTIDLSGDSSGFLAATKLSGASTSTGLDDERTLAIVDVDALNNVKTGTLSINGVDIALDRNVDSLDDMVARINASAAGATLSFDEATGAYALQNNVEGTQLVLDDGGTRFFELLGMTLGAHQAPSEGGDDTGAALRQGREFERTLRDFERCFDRVMNLVGDARDTRAGARVAKSLTAAVHKQFSGADEDAQLFRSALGISLDMRADTGSAGLTLRTTGTGALHRIFADSKGRAKLQEFFLGRSERQRGFIADMDAALVAVSKSLAATHGTSGLLLNSYA